MVIRDPSLFASSLILQFGGLNTSAPEPLSQLDVLGYVSLSFLSVKVRVGIIFKLTVSLFSILLSEHGVFYIRMFLDNALAMVR